MYKTYWDSKKNCFDSIEELLYSWNSDISNWPNNKRKLKGYNTKRKINGKRRDKRNPTYRFYQENKKDIFDAIFDEYEKVIQSETFQKEYFEQFVEIKDLSIDEPKEFNISARNKIIGKIDYNINQAFADEIYKCFTKLDSREKK